MSESINGARLTWADRRKSMAAITWSGKGGDTMWVAVRCSKAIWLAVTAFAALAASQPVAAQSFDSTAPRQASRLLQPAQKQSSIHTVDEVVPIVTHTYVFTLQTNWGPMRAYGYDALVLRLRELYAIQALEDT